MFQNSLNQPYRELLTAGERSLSQHGQSSGHMSGKLQTYSGRKLLRKVLGE